MGKIEVDFKLWNALGGIELENNLVKSSKRRYTRNSSPPLTRLSVSFWTLYSLVIRCQEIIISFPKICWNKKKTKKMGMFW